MSDSRRLYAICCGVLVMGLYEGGWIWGRSERGCLTRLEEMDLLRAVGLVSGTAVPSFADR